MNNRDLKESFKKIRNGDKEAFVLVFNELKKPVFTVVCRIVGDISVAEDITQEVFVKLFVSPPDSSVNNPRAWIFRIAHNLSIDSLRKKHSLNIDDIELVVDDAFEQIVTHLDIESAINRLTDTERQVISLHLNGGLTFAEISAIMNLSQSAVYRNYRKALKTLRRILNGGAL